MSGRDELRGLRQLLEGLDSSRLVLSQNGEDVSKREAEALRRDIGYLETVLRRSQARGGTAR